MKKKFRVATEGATTDGRAISRTWIEQMAASFNPEKYGARIWMEHMRSMHPEGAFKAFGDVTALETNENSDGKLELIAEIDPTDELVKMSKDRQKIYTSIEVDPDFAGSGQAYMVGLAVTDSPSSLGTEMLKFSSTAENSPLASRKQRPENLFSAALDAELNFEEEPSTPESDTLFTKVKALFSKHRDASAAKFSEFRSDLEKTLELFVTDGQQLRASMDEMSSEYSQMKTSLGSLRAEFNTLKKEIETSPHNHSQRQPASGSADETLTDC